MAASITMPKLGLTMTEGTISKWLKKEGDPVAAGETLFTVSTDKLTYDYQAEVSGTLLKIFLNENESIPVGGEVAVIGKAGESVGTMAAAPVAETVENTPVSVALTELVTKATPQPMKAEDIPAGSVLITPKARAFAKNRGLDLSQIPGHGEPPMAHLTDAKAYAEAHCLNATPKARAFARSSRVDIALVPGHGEPPMVHVVDVEAWMAANRTKVSPLAAKMAADLGVDVNQLGLDRRVMSADVLKATGMAPVAEAPKPAAGAAPVSAAENQKPMTRMRQIISERMTESATKVPTVNYQTDVDCTELKALRASLKNVVKVSFNDIIMKACAQTLMEMPMCNCSTDMANKRYVMHDFVNIGLAVSVEGGLIVPNVKNVQMKGLAQISADSAALVEKARKGGLTPEDMSGGTFTISTLGMFGIRHFTPIINPPESCILGVTMIEDRAVVRNGQLAAAPMTTFCLTADHRAVDGADAAKFLLRLKELLENPYLMLL